MLLPVILPAGEPLGGQTREVDFEAALPVAHLGQKADIAVGQHRERRIAGITAPDAPPLGPRTPLVVAEQHRDVAPLDRIERNRVQHSIAPGALDAQRIAHDIAVAGGRRHILPPLRLAPRRAAVRRKGILAPPLGRIADAHQPAAVGPLDELRLVAVHIDRRGQQAPAAAAILRHADIVDQRRGLASRTGRHDEEQRPVAQLQRTPRGGKGAVPPPREGICAGRAPQLGRDAFGRGPRLPKIAAPADVDVNRRLGCRLPQPAPRGEDAEQLARAGIAHQRRIAVAAVAAVFGNRDDGGPGAAPVGAAPRHEVDFVGQVAHRLEPAVGHGHQRAVVGRHQRRNAVILRTTVAGGEEERAHGLFGSPGTAAAPQHEGGKQDSGQNLHRVHRGRGGSTATEGATCGP